MLKLRNTNTKMLEKIENIIKEPRRIAAICDHTSLLPPESKKYQILGKNPEIERRKDLDNFLYDAINSSIPYYGVCIRGVETKIGREAIDKAGSNLALVVTTGFPNLTGNISLATKIDETIAALDNGADEVDGVINWQQLKEGNLFAIKKELQEVSRYTKRYGKIYKIILEVCNLEPGEIATACQIAEGYGADFVKTSSGFSSGGATPAALAIMKSNFTKSIKAAGGVNMKNIGEILTAMSGREDDYIDFDPKKIRIGESSLFNGLGIY
jgi:deoxyribose-phosphate aldolase